MPEQLSDTIVNPTFLLVVRTLAIVIGGFVLGRILSRLVSRLTRDSFTAQLNMVLRRLVYYGLVSFALVIAIQGLGVDLSVLLGAAGILTVAIGFASQTSASNLIAGLFLMGERAFEVGDYIKVGQSLGTVLSIDLLSVKLRTADNLFVRVPNEQVIKSEVTNFTRFDIRRLDLTLNVAFEQEVAAVRQLLMQLAVDHPLILEEPVADLFFVGFGESAQMLEFRVWTERVNFLKLKAELNEEIKRVFDQNQIEVPYPRRMMLSPKAAT